MARNKRRHSTGFGYIGFGNNQNVFNQYANKPFSSLKEKLNSETHLHYQLNFSNKKLTKSEKEVIKNKIRKAEKIRMRKIIFIFVFVFILILFVIKLLIDSFMSNL
ncbi:hypothetical protein [Flavivirga rizhaonensis]|uniref:Uncharacterized protein n=1 Tax=Flavivirga rizhaonensis TaxID=2559571 RepID=A0A4S1E353_9FLAO|nr:hypothetical protein [Flavivirga rizhaonensis]TGV04803.1 hypothetical protein EM932_01395 [Flavivirga rizhaonensis]